MKRTEEMCTSREKPMKIFLETVTIEQLCSVRLLDWLEGYGEVMSPAEVLYLRTYGSLLVKLKAENKRYKDALEKISYPHHIRRGAMIDIAQKALKGE